MKFKSIYVISIVAFTLSTLLFFFFRERVIFFLYGYDQRLINSDTFEAFAAYKKIYHAKWIFFFVTFAITVVCGILSYIATNHKEQISKMLSFMFLYLAIIVLLILIVGLIGSRLTGRVF